ncbi:hypothetical protein JOB18_036802 [Solea senegalensis]|uniref:Uncharacterized protein n=1 Tax=Solea senegalensis TaxID=28829 RepID=A0AAV6SNV8_SOLSE|nr:hypothetical protein JOB18_036802 [Solea senegalensis]
MNPCYQEQEVGNKEFRQIVTLQLHDDLDDLALPPMREKKVEREIGGQDTSRASSEYENSANSGTLRLRFTALAQEKQLSTKIACLQSDHVDYGIDTGCLEGHWRKLKDEHLLFNFHCFCGSLSKETGDSSLPPRSITAAVDSSLCAAVLLEIISPRQQPVSLPDDI